MKALQSTILLDYRIDNDQISTDIDQFLNSPSESESFFLNNLVLTEVITTFEESSEFNHSDSFNVLHALVYNSQIRFENRKIVVEAFQMYKKKKGKFSECLKSAVNQHYQAADTMYDLQPSGTITGF